MNRIKSSLLLLLCLNLNCTYAEPKDTNHACSSSFGSILGTNSNVIGYSNCNNDTESNLWNTIQINGNKNIETGMKWQCVEYARRWLITQKGYTFASIDHAYQIWDLLVASNIMTGEETLWKKCSNTKTKYKPQRGDLLIYDRTQGEHGHVAVIVDVINDSVFIAEQNYSNLPWQGEIYARKLQLTVNTKGIYTLKDSGVIGWMRIAI